MRDFLAGIFTRNKALKLLSLISAVLIWYAVASEPTAEVSYTVPVEFHDVPPELEMLTPQAPQVTVRMRASDRLLRQLTPADVHPVLSVTELKDGGSGTERTFEINEDRVLTPPGVEVIQVTPSTIRVAFDQRAVRKVPVRPRVLGNFAAGYEISEVASNPPQVTVVGPKSRIELVEAATTDPIDASGIIGDTVGFTVTAYVTDPLVRVARPSEVRVNVTTARAGSAAAQEQTTKQEPKNE